MSTQSDTFPFGQQVVWQPNTRWIEESNLYRFMTRHGIHDYETLYRRSINDIGWFWNEVLTDLNIEFYQPYHTIVDLREGIQFPRWCVGGKMNIVHNMLDKWLGTTVQNRAALRWEGEEGVTRIYTYADLHYEVCRCANALRSLGLGKGDAVGLYMPMVPELAIAFLAIIKIGGIVLPLFSGYGPGAISTRLVDAGAKAIFTTDRALRRGKIVPMKPNVDEALKDAPTVKHVIVVNRAGMASLHWTAGRDYWWNELVATQSQKTETTLTDAEDVCMLIYTSGTTGAPKGAVHTHCGFPIKAAQDMWHAMDLKPQDTMYWMTDMGWMMGPWEVFGSLLIGATMVFYDGAPDYPNEDRLWSLIQRHNITHLGVSPSLIRTLKAYGKEPVQRYNISSLRMVGSTGSPWDPDSWLWLFNTVLEGKKPILNYSGGTEISGGILCGNFFTPLKPAAFSGPVPGMAADVVDDHGQPVRGAVGELVITKPWIGMTRGFWKNRERYRETYWNRFENVWVHGDFAAIDADGLWYILGRSDDTIKIAGKRLGPSEVEAILNAHPSVAESAAIGIPHPIKDQEVICFCVLNSSIDANEKLRTDLIQLLVTELGKALQPKEVKFVDSLPKTRNAKIMRRVIRAAYLAEDPGDLSSLEDAKTVEAIKRAH